MLSLFFLFTLSFVAFAVLRLLPVDQRASARHVQDVQATFVADAGIHAAMERLEWEFKQGLGATPIWIGPADQTPPTSASPLATNCAKLYGTPYSFNVTIQPDTSTMNNNPKRVFMVSSTAYRVDGSGVKALRTINATLANDSFAKWVWFHDTRPTDLYLPVNQWTFDGPLHFNSPIRLQGVNSAFYSGSHVPFQSTVTSASRIEKVQSTYNNPVDSGLPTWANKGDGIKYTDSGGSMGTGNTPYDSTGVQDASKYAKLYAGGRQAVTTEVAPVEMPDNFDKIKSGAWGTTTSLPTVDGVYANTKTSGDTELAGGLYIRGDVAQMELLVPTTTQNANTRIRMYEPPTPGASPVLFEYKFVDVTDNLETVTPKTNGTSGTTQSVGIGESYLTKQRVRSTGGLPQNTIQSDGSGGVPDAGNITVTKFTNQSNGVVFSTGDINKFWGENKGKKTICADLETKKQIHIVDDILRNDTPVNGTTGIANSFDKARPTAQSDLDKYKPTGSRDVLGLVAWKIRLKTPTEMKSTNLAGTLTDTALVALGLNPAEGRSGASNPLYVYATMYAGHERVSGNAAWDNYDDMGGLYDDYNSGAGELHLYGGMQLAYKNATQYDLELHYDPILARTPPPFYPSYEKIVILTWREWPLPD